MGQDYDDTALVPMTTFERKLQGGLANFVPGAIAVSAISRGHAPRADRDHLDLARSSPRGVGDGGRLLGEEPHRYHRCPPHRLRVQRGGGRRVWPIPRTQGGPPRSHRSPPLRMRRGLAQEIGRVSLGVRDTQCVSGGPCSATETRQDQAGTFQQRRVSSRGPPGSERWRSLRHWERSTGS